MLATARGVFVLTLLSNIDSYANALYLHAINTILPPTPPGSESDPKAPEPTLDEVCRGTPYPLFVVWFVCAYLTNLILSSPLTSLAVGAHVSLRMRNEDTIPRARC